MQRLKTRTSTKIDGRVARPCATIGAQKRMSHLSVADALALRYAINATLASNQFGRRSLRYALAEEGTTLRAVRPKVRHCTRGVVKALTLPLTSRRLLLSSNQCSC